MLIKRQLAFRKFWKWFSFASPMQHVFSLNKMLGDMEENAILAKPQGH
jgi:hypothetical protein